MQVKDIRLTKREISAFKLGGRHVRRYKISLLDEAKAGHSHSNVLDEDNEKLWTTVSHPALQEPHYKGPF